MWGRPDRRGVPFVQSTAFAKISFSLRRLALGCLLFWAAAASASDTRLVRHVSDGDTLVLENGEKVRLIGVDTPELSSASRNHDSARRNHLDEKTVEEFAKRAKSFTEGLVEGQAVRLEYDWQRIDKYGRTLAYVYRNEDGLLVNAEIIRQGYGFPIVHFIFKYKDDFRKLGEEARQAGRGMWAAQGS